MRLFFLFLFSISLVACKKEETPPADIGLHYYPNQINFYRIFKVDSIVFNDFTESTDTFQYFIKESLVEHYTIENETRTRVLEQYKNKLTDEFWIDRNSFSFQKDNFSVEENRDNLPKVVLVFPIDENVSWNSNVRNTLEPEEYVIESMSAETINGNELKDVITVEQFNETDPLQLNTEIGTVKFAPNIGLVHKYEKRVKRFTTGEEDDIPVDSGFVLTKQIEQYGQL